jgi:hypothetical protein
MGGVVFRPLSWFRAHGALGTNAIGVGIRGGLALRLPTWISPAVGLEAGHYFDGDANSVVGLFGHNRYENTAITERVGYTFANFHVGLELGSTRSAFYFHGGMSYVGTTLHNTEGTLFKNGASSDDSTSISIGTDPRINAWFPSLKLGFLIYFV